jgi:hypothetical protein
MLPHRPRTSRAPLAASPVPFPAGLALGLALAATLAACGGARGDFTSEIPSCPGVAELVVANEVARSVRVLEQSTVEPTRVLGDIPGRDTVVFPARQLAGIYYSVVMIDTGELLASESAHPRGRTSRGATLSRRCSDED